MELLLLTPHYAPDFEGGTEYVARAQARELARLGHDVRILSGSDRPFSGGPEGPEGPDAEPHRVDGLEVTVLRRRPEEPYDLALDRPRLGARIDAALGGAQLAHLHHWSTLTADTVRRLAARVPVVVTLHDLFTTCPRYFRVPAPTVERCPEERLPTAEDHAHCARCLAPDAGGLAPEVLVAGLEARSRWMRAELEAAAAVLVPSRAHRERLVRVLPYLADRVRVLAHGLCAPPGSFDVSGAALPWTGEGRLRVLSLGHRTAVKGLEDLVRALAAPDLCARVELVLLGEEVEAGFDDRLRALARDLPITFGGGYRVEALARRVVELGGAHLAALPSRVNESYGLVLDEAQALGLPAWVADRGAPRERVGGAGRVLPAQDPDSWGAAFAQVLERPAILESERRALPASVRTAHDAARELSELYASLVDPGADDSDPHA